VLMDASSLGSKIKEGKNQKTLLSEKDEAQIIDTFSSKKAVDDFSVVISYEDIAAKKYSLSAGQYFDIKIKYTDISEKEFKLKMETHQKIIKNSFDESKEIESEIFEKLSQIKYE